MPLDFLSSSPCYGMLPKMTQKIAADGDRNFNAQAKNNRDDTQPFAQTSYAEH